MAYNGSSNQQEKVECVPDVSETQVNSVDDVEKALQETIETLKNSLKKTSLEAATAISEKYCMLFAELNECVKGSKEMQATMIQFAKRFRPMNRQAFKYVLEIQSFAVSLQEDKIPTLKECLECDEPDLGTLTQVVAEISDAYQPVIAIFHEIKQGYESLVFEAHQLDLHAQNQIVESGEQITTARSAEALGYASLGTSAWGGVGIAGGIALSGVEGWTAGTVCGAVMGPPGWVALIAAGAVAGGAAIHAGCAAKQCHESIVLKMHKIHEIMKEIISLVDKHDKELLQIGVTMKKLVADTQTLSESLHAWQGKKASGQKVAVPCNRATRQLQIMAEDCKGLASKCEQFVASENQAQKQVWDLLSR